MGGFSPGCRVSRLGEPTSFQPRCGAFRRLRLKSFSGAKPRFPTRAEGRASGLS